MDEAARRHPLTAEAHVWSHSSPCGICGGQSGAGTHYTPTTSGVSCQYHTHSLIYHRRCIILATDSIVKTLKQDRQSTYNVTLVLFRPTYYCHRKATMRSLCVVDLHIVLSNIRTTVECWHTWCGRKVMRLATLCTNWQCCCLPLRMAVRLTPAVDSYKSELATIATRLLRASEVKLCLWGALRKWTGKSLSNVVPSNFV